MEETLQNDLSSRKRCEVTNLRYVWLECMSFFRYLTSTIYILNYSIKLFFAGMEALLLALSYFWRRITKPRQEKHWNWKSNNLWNTKMESSTWEHFLWLKIAYQYSTFLCKLILVIHLQHLQNGQRHLPFPNLQHQSQKYQLAC